MRNKNREVLRRSNYRIKIRVAMLAHEQHDQPFGQWFYYLNVHIVTLRTYARAGATLALRFRHA